MSSNWPTTDAVTASVGRECDTGAAADGTICDGETPEVSGAAVDADSRL